MAVSLINNLGSLDSQSKLNVTGGKLNSTIQRLSSGLRINNSGDDAAGLAIANAYRSDISTLRQGVRNANDGLSTLQIVDGGLNTISGLLDRATTLASQSASGTFDGNRDTLQREFGNLLNEISRQAQNIGLGGASGTEAGRFNKQLDVFIGGGTTADSANNQVSIDLSNSRVDSVGLELNDLNIGNAIGKITSDGNISGGLTGAEVLTFQYVNESGAQATKTVSLASGTSAENVVSTINATAELAEAGIKASLSEDGANLVLESSKFLAVSSDTAGSAAGTVFGATTDDDEVLYSTALNRVDIASAASTGAGNQTITFSGLSSELSGVTNGSYDLTVASGGAQAAGQNAVDVAAAVNGDATLRAAGIFAVVDDGDTADAATVRFVSTGDFSVNVNTADATAASLATTTSAEAAAGATSTTGGVQGAKDALTAVKEAIANLGIVQGKVGAGQNTLSASIDLATSQINNFQAAESRVRDADVAAEASNLARLTTLQQAGVAALAQANQSSQAVLSLLR
ncbi:MAG: flagellin [Pyrinomonadaceae bacterium]